VHILFDEVTDARSSEQKIHHRSFVFGVPSGLSQVRLTLKTHKPIGFTFVYPSGLLLNLTHPDDRDFRKRLDNLAETATAHRTTTFHDSGFCLTYASANDQFIHVKVVVVFASRWRTEGNFLHGQCDPLFGEGQRSVRPLSTSCHGSSRRRSQFLRACCEACAIFATASLSASRRGFLSLLWLYFRFACFVGACVGPLIGASWRILTKLLTNHLFA